jgi:leucyl aminopeptidase
MNYMKIAIAKEVPKGTVVIQKSAHDDLRFVEKDGVQSLHVPFAKKQQYRSAIRTLRHIVRTVKAKKIEKVAIDWSLIHEGVSKDISDEQCAESIASHAIAAWYDFESFKSEKSKAVRCELFITGAPDVADSIKKGVVIGESLNEIRELANMPAGHLTPAILASEAKKMMTGVSKTKVTIFDENKIASLKMGALLAVGGGSKFPPRLIIAEYMNGPKGEAPIVFVGKGITFDTGGIQVKPGSGSSIHEMHLDMSGGAVVLGALKALARLGVKKNIVAIVSSAENMISHESMRPGDIVTSMSGKTIEILHTDAEGRLVLCDALTYAQKTYKPKLIVDVATLTGAALVALGTTASAYMTRQDDVCDKVYDAGEATGELMWPLPMWDDYAYMTKSDRADIANIANDWSRYGGTINGAMFLGEFVDHKQPWVHIDMAPRMDANPRDHLAKGSTGEPVRTLVKLAETDF